MLNTNLFDIPPTLSMFLPYIAAGMLAWIVWRLSAKLTLPRFGRPQVTRIETFRRDAQTRRHNGCGSGQLRASRADRLHKDRH